MKNRLITGASAAALIAFFSGGSQATGLADYSSSASDEWSGLYVGATAGYGWGDYRQNDNGLGGARTFSMDGFAGGGTLGYNIQLANFIIGLETDFQFSDINGLNSSYETWECDTSCSNSIEWFGTVRGRVGLQMNGLMPFITGGLAYAKVNSGDSYVDNTLFKNSFSFKGSNTFTRFGRVETGWTVGGGVEKTFGQNLSIKAEVLYIDLGISESGKLSGFNVRNEFTVARIGVNFRF